MSCFYLSPYIFIDRTMIGGRKFYCYLLLWKFYCYLLLRGNRDCFSLPRLLVCQNFTSTSATVSGRLCYRWLEVCSTRIRICLTRVTANHSNQNRQRRNPYIKIESGPCVYPRHHYAEFFVYSKKSHTGNLEVSLDRFSMTAVLTYWVLLENTRGFLVICLK